MTPVPSLLQRAVLELGVDVPVYRTQAAPGGTITLYCYGGVIRTWQPPADLTDPEMAPSPPAPEDPVATDAPPASVATPKPKKPRATKARA